MYPYIGTIKAPSTIIKAISANILSPQPADTQTKQALIL
jgi:hypothetical protein